MLLEKLENKIKMSCSDFNLLENSFTETERLQLEEEKKLDKVSQSLLNTQDCGIIRWLLCTRPKYFIMNSSMVDLLFQYLEMNDKYIVFKSCEILTSYYEDDVPEDNYWKFCKKILLSGKSYEEMKQILYFLAEILYIKKHGLRISDDGKGLFDRNVVKVYFCTDERFMDLIFKFLRVRETQYYVLRICWILSFNKKCIEILDLYNLIENIVLIIKERSKEKILRLCFGIIRNFLEFEYSFGINKTHQILQEVEKFLGKKQTDPEFISDLEFTRSKLNFYLKNSSSINNYFNELFGGKLEEAPYHYTDSFWESNIKILLENKVEIVKALRRYLKSQNSNYICISANDIYHFVKVAPEICSLICKFKLKEDLFLLTSSPNDDVRFYAIQALATCIFSEWA
ncbi:subunit H of V-type proton ATPase [Hamiltosporidium tvaerminnensis]|uniref:Subunit H of V-type proton ATPase n=1 Tax=Hamiltosporidium tvaerminnensis TaxID=1176355 RepID=A0A4V2JUK4_9MICR|nr:subunit H of V-type proton ATPase [Hamiltosporidium tvaerminnensis]TBU13609.1 subunit H of V-type proton ATPase [Hamiltosporidium tvaerminnensis]